MKLASTLLASTLLLLGAAAPTFAAEPMGFFITSAGPGKGGDLGGIEGADAHCGKLAEAAGSTGRTWRAYLSTQAVGDERRGKSARQRIGNGPWYNAKGELIAKDLDELHLNPNIIKTTALDESGNPVKGVGDKPNEHDILTGGQSDGMSFFAREKKDKTCSNWTSSGEGSASLGHHDRHGGGNTSWNAAHDSIGCSQDALTKTGGAGLFYCFAAE